MSSLLPAFTVKNSNSIEVLAFMCNEQMKIPLSSPLSKEHIIVMNSGMKSYLQQFIAEHSEVCANVSFDNLWSFIWDIYRLVTPDLGSINYFEHDYIIWTLYQMLHVEHTADIHEELSTLKNYIKDDTDGTRTYELCVAIADTFDQYMMYRHDWILMWDAIAQSPEDSRTLLIERWKEAVIRGFNNDLNENSSRKSFSSKKSLLASVLDDNLWQPSLWTMLFERITRNNEKIEPSRYDRSMVIADVCTKLKALDTEEAAKASLPERVFIFGVSSLQPQIIRFLRSLSKHVDVNVMLLNPCREYWGDLDNEWIKQFSDYKKSLSVIKQKLKQLDKRRDFTDEELRQFSSMTDKVYGNNVMPLKGKELNTTEQCYDDNGELVEGNALLLALGKQGKDNLSLMLDSHVGENLFYIKADPVLSDIYRNTPFNQHLEMLSDRSSDSVDPCFDNIFIDPIKAGGNSVLHHIQSQILNLEQPKTRVEIENTDHSFEIHSCHTEQREIEVLRDALLTRFKDSVGPDGRPSLKPRDCIVMMPQIEKYAPYIEAVFGSVSPDDKNYIPYYLADRTSKDSSLIADAVIKLLDVGVRRITLSFIIDLLTVPAIASRFSFKRDDIEAIRTWCLDTNIHWGIDEKDALKDSDIKDVPWTFEKGLERMIRGYLIGDSATSNPNYTEIEGSDASVLGRFYLFIKELKALRDLILPKETSADSTDPGRDIYEWEKTLEEEIFEKFFYDKNERNLDQDETYRECMMIKHMCSHVSRVISNLGLRGSDSDSRLKITLPVFRSLLVDKLSTSTESSRFKGNHVIFCSMIPMRAIPFKHLFVIGLNDGNFPRQDKIPAFNLVGVKGLFRRGDRSRSIDDRYCFMEAILSARESLYLSYIGKNPIDNTDRNRSTVLEDLFDYICDVFTVKDKADNKDSSLQHKKSLTQALSCRLIRQEPLTSFNPLNYTKEDSDRELRHLPSFDVSSFITESSPKKERVYLGNMGIGFFNIKLEDPVKLNVETLKKWLIRPAKEFLKQNFAIALSSDNNHESDDESFCLGDYKTSLLLQELYKEKDSELYLSCKSENGSLPYGVLSYGIKKDLINRKKLMNKAYNDIIGSNKIVTKRFYHQVKLSFSEFSSVLESDSPLLEKLESTVIFSGTVTYPHVELYYFSGGQDLNAKQIIGALLSSFALYYASCPSQVSIIDNTGNEHRYNVSQLAKEEIDFYFKALLKIAVIAMLRPLPVTNKIVTRIANNKNENEFFNYEPECSYLFGSYNKVSEELKAFLKAGLDKSESTGPATGILSIYDTLRSVCKVVDTPL